MVWVAVVAVNLAVFRALYTTRRIDILVGGGVFWVALQVGAILVIRGCVRSRSFWQGFVGGGTIASFFFIAAFSFPKSAAGESWKAYLVVADRLLLNDKTQRMLARVFGNVWGELAEVLTFTAIEFLPLVLAALVGAICVHRISVTKLTPVVRRFRYEQQRTQPLRRP
jgi:hypothetical protein